MKGLFNFLLVIALGACVKGLPNPSIPCSNYPGGADRLCGAVTKIVHVEGDKRTMRPEDHQISFCTCPEGQQCSSSLGYNRDLPALEKQSTPTVVYLNQPGFCGAPEPVLDCDENTRTLTFPDMNPIINRNQYCRCPSGRNMVSQDEPQDENSPPSLYKTYVCPE